MTTPPTAPVDETPTPAEPLAQEPWGAGRPAPAEPSRLRRIGRRVGGPLLLVALIIGGLVVAGMAGKSDPEAAKAGDCVHDLGGGGSKPKMEIVDCTKATADFKVTKVVHDGDAKHACDSEPEEVFGSYSEERRSTIVVLCLALNADRPGGPAPLPSWPAL
ncbi:hypothetical protein BX285_4180 [Streptomyces sp. 1114.5]|uniref:LppU/SCO3897 family protein n=1 Tax=unclassified Streptomyces TaxID=2593676 RepID=UPI000BD4588F|nr:MULTISPECIES: hypothetical protein [unclassified Streptomyces]RKT19711.1 hypothetical protein BX285_4180 [Streptomyces sp. 1114.5]SOB85910.1 hypothetical protein SAMN06272789_6211 [Streptomyces sp. 1331.2]